MAAALRVELELASKVPVNEPLSFKLIEQMAELLLLVLLLLLLLLILLSLLIVVGELRNAWLDVWLLNVIE